MTDTKEPLLPKDTDVVHLSLAPVICSRVAAFAALRMADDCARVYFNHSAQAELFGLTAQQGDPHSGLQRIVQIAGPAGLFVDVDVDLSTHGNSVSLRYGPDTITVALTVPQPDLLQGHDCLLTTVNQALSVPLNGDAQAANPMADPEYIRSWLAHHAVHQGVTAALILNRLGPDQTGADFAGHLQDILHLNPTARLGRVVVLDVPVATGRQVAGDERHLLFAPDAPGKNRMEPPAPDPWRAPFADEVLLDYLHHAFFPQADGVSYLDLSDWLAPPSKGDVTVFQAARRASPDPLLGLTGLRAYPWKIRDQAAPQAGDHICRPFDLEARFSRWVVSPAMTGHKDQLWRPHRIIGLKGQTSEQTKLWRFMALRHPQAAPAQLVPKSSLREDDALLAFSLDILGHNAFRVPAATTGNNCSVRSLVKRSNKIVVVTSMKNEGPFLLEWIAYHRAIGVSDIIVFSNDCTDGTDVLLDILAERGIVEHYPNPYREMNLRPQHAGFRAAEGMETVKNADWLMTLDVDEFINIHVGNGHLHDLFATIGDANMISCTWRLFGNGGLHEFGDNFVTRQFIQCATTKASRPHQAWGFKTLYQNNGYFKKLGVHRPKGLRASRVEDIRWVNGSGQVLPETEYRSGWRSNAQTIGYDMVTLNHYAVRTTESFLVKRDRGRVNHIDRDQGSAYWFRMNHNTTTDLSIQRMIPALDAQYRTYLNDPDIAQAHADCVARHREKITELRARDDYAQFYGVLTSPRMARLARLHGHFGANVFLSGPDVIPDEIIEKDPEEDWFFTVDLPDQTNH